VDLITVKKEILKKEHPQYIKDEQGSLPPKPVQAPKPIAVPKVIPPPAPKPVVNAAPVVVQEKKEVKPRQRGFSFSLFRKKEKIEEKPEKEKEKKTEIPKLKSRIHSMTFSFGKKKSQTQMGFLGGYENI
jgi:hypothetical protein